MAGDSPLASTLVGIARPPMDPIDRDMMIRTIAGEAGNQPPLGQAAVAHAILNRAADGGYGGNRVRDVVTAPVKPGSRFHQFSVWNPPGVVESSPITQGIQPNDPNYQKIGGVVDQVYNGAIPDPTNGATHYYAPGAMPGRRPPPWAAALASQNQVRIGDQVFVGGSTGPGQTLPSQFTGGYIDAGENLT
jgi:conjugal transfer mating pair stabilization protein TraG